MVKVFCDKCGKEVPDEEMPFKYGLPLFRVTHVCTNKNKVDGYLEHTNCELTICPECQAKLYEFIFGRTYEEDDRERLARENKENAAVQFI